MTEYERVKQELEEWVHFEGVTPSVLLQLTDPLRTTLKHLMRQGSMTFEELSKELHIPMPETEVIAELMVSCGILKTSEMGPEGEIVYRLRHSKSHRPKSPAAMWSLLIDEDNDGGDGSDGDEKGDKGGKGDGGDGEA